MKKIKKRIVSAKKEAKNRGRQVSEKTMSHICLNIFLTNIPSDKLPNFQIRTLYRLRWQVELIFKVWKSIGKIDNVKKTKKDRFETMLYGKLIWLLLNWSIFWQINLGYWKENKKILSIIKMFKTFELRFKKFIEAIKNGKLSTLKYIKAIIDMSPKVHRFEKKKNKLSSLEIIMMFNM